MRMFRKIIAAVLVLVFAAGGVDGRAFAAGALNFSYDTQNSLRPSTDIVPSRVLNTEVAPNDLANSVTMSFDIGQTGQDGVWQFVYHMPENKTVVGILDNNNRHYRFKYLIFTGGTATPDALIVGGAANRITVNGDGGVYTTPENYPYTSANPGPGFWLEQDGNGYPLYHMTEVGRGFSFRHNGVDISFRIENNGTAGNKFWFTTGGMTPGYIYDFKLTSADGSSVMPDFGYTPVRDPAAPFDAFEVFTGYTGFTSESYAYVPHTNRAGHYPIINPANNETVILDEDLQVPTGSAYPYDEPALEPRLVMSFDLPKAWDGTGSAFAVPGSYGRPFPAHMNLADYMITLDDVFADADAPGYVNISGGTTGAVAATVEPEIAGSKVRLTIDKLNDSTILAPTTIGEDMSPGLWWTHETAIPYGLLYTALDYEFKVRGKSYIVEFNPYEGYEGEGTFFLEWMVPPTGTGDTTASVRSTEYAMIANGAGPLTLPTGLNVDSNESRYYRIRFESTALAKPLYSQTMKLTPDSTDVTIGTPEDFDIIGHNLVPLETPQNPNEKIDEANLYVEMRWQIGDTNTILNLLDKSANGEITVTYDLRSTQDRTVVEPVSAVNITIIKDPAAAPYGFRMEYEESGPDDVDDPANLVNTGTGARVEPNRGELLFGSEYGMPENGRPPFPTDEIDTTAPGDWRYDRFYAHVKFRYDALRDGLAGDPDFSFPGIYFMYVEATQLKYIPKGQTAEIIAPVTDAASDYDSMTLSDIQGAELPPPQNFSAEDASVDEDGVLGEITAELNWIVPLDKVNEYINSVPYHPPYKVGSEVFFSQDENELKAFMDALALSGLRFDLHGDITDEEYENYSRFILEHSEFDVMVKPFSFGYHSGIVDANTDILSALRDGKIIWLKNMAVRDYGNDDSHNPTTNTLDNGNLSQMLRVSGLDPNQKYYFTAGISLNSELRYYNSDGIETDKDKNILPTPVKPEDRDRQTDYSPLVTLEALTTPGEPQTPDPSENLPKAPVLNVDRENIELSSATVYWPPVTDVQPETISYELIRIKDKEFDPQALLDDRTLDYAGSELEEAVGILGGHAYAISTAGELTAITAGAPTNIETTIGEATFNGVTGVFVQFFDKTLLPNNLYFYYVRTVKTVGTRVYSTWSAVTLTTNTVQAPEGLYWDREYDGELDEMHEAAVRFDAHVPFPPLASDMGTKYYFEYSLLKDGPGAVWGEPVRMTDSAHLLESALESELADCTNFGYIIEGLESGMTYQIRVRMVVIDGDNTDRSAWSNSAEIKTAVDEDKAEDDRKKDEWDDYFRDLMNKLSITDIWVSDDHRDYDIAIYRPTRFNAVMAAQTGSELALVTPSRGSMDYFIPASAYMLAIAANRTFTLRVDGTELVIPAKAISFESNAAVLEMRQLIKENRIEDFYVRLSVTYEDYADLVNGKKPLSKRLDLGFELVGLQTTAEEVDALTYAEVLAVIADWLERDSVSEDIYDLIEGDALNEDLVALIDEIIADAKDDISESISDVHNDAMASSRFRRGFEFDTPFTFAMPNTPVDMVAEGFKYLDNGAWTPVAASLSGNGKRISANSAGFYIFAGYAFELPVIPGVDAGVISRLYIKYQLADILDDGTMLDPARALSTADYQAVIARVAGAAFTDDPAAFLRGKGVDLTGLRQNGNIQKQEAVYLSAMLYELRTGTKITTVRITNFTLTAGVTGLDARFRQPVQAAYQLGIFADKAMNAKAAGTVGDLMTMLGNINKKMVL